MGKKVKEIDFVGRIKIPWPNGISRRHIEFLTNASAPLNKEAREEVENKRSHGKSEKIALQLGGSYFVLSGRPFSFNF